MKIRKQNRYYLLIALIVSLLSFTACSKDEIKDSGKESTTEHIDYEKVFNPLNISSELYNICEEEQFIDEEKNVKYISSLLINTEANDEKSYVDIDIHEHNNDNYLVEYMYASEEELIDGSTVERHLVLFEKKTGKLLKEMVFKVNETFAQVKADSIWVKNENDGEVTIQTYDFELNEIAKYTITEDELEPIVTSDGKRMYYIYKHKLFVYDSVQDLRTELDSKDKFAAYDIMEIITDEAGRDYVFFSGMAADYNIYNFIYDTFNGKIVRVEDTDIYYDIKENTAIKSKYSEAGYEQEGWVVGISDTKGRIFNVTDEVKENQENGRPVNLHVLSNGDLLFNSSDGKKVYIDVYEKDTGILKGSTVIDLEKLRRDPLKESMKSQMDYYAGGMGVYGKTFYLDENVMLLTLKDFFGTEYYLEWQMESVIENNIVEVSEYDIDKELSVDVYDIENEFLLPGEINNELMPLNETALRLEREYGVQINIGNECADVCNTYLIYPLNNYEQVESALKELEVALKKYPDNFFTQFKYDNVDGIDIHISAEIVGISDEALSVAGGFKCFENGKIKLVMDSRNKESFNTTFHHELCHAIDEVISYKQIYSSEEIFSEDKWNEFNPHNDMYTYNYVDWGKQEYYRYTYNFLMCEPDFGKGEIYAYFIDSYAMTYPTEDRARLFENVMCEHGKYVKYEKSPYLRAKLNYFAKAIKASFDTTGWEDVPWEAYMEEE